MSEGSGLSATQRRSVEPGDIGPIAQYFVNHRAKELTEESQNRYGNTWWRGECPECGHHTYGACLEWGKAGCRNKDCTKIPQVEKWQEIVERIERLENPDAAAEETAEDNRGRNKRLKQKALGIVAEYEESQRKQREDQEQAEAEKEQRQEQARLREEQEKQARQTAQDDEEQELLDNHREQKEEKHRKQERERKERERRERAEHSESTIERVLLAKSTITQGEAVFSGAWALVTTLIIYYGLWWLQPSLGELEWVSREVLAELAAYRLPAGLLGGMLAGWLVWRKLSRSRRWKWRLAGDEQGEYIGSYRYADGEEKPIRWQHLEADGSELSTGPAKRFAHGMWRGLLYALKMLLKLVAAVSAAIWEGLSRADLPWGGIIWRTLLAAVAVFALYWIIGFSYIREWASVVAVLFGIMGLAWAFKSANDSRHRLRRR